MSSNKRALEAFIQREVLANQTVLVETCLEKGVLYYHDIKNLRKSTEEMLEEGYSPDQIERGDAQDCKEIFEWWLVTPWLAERLADFDEPILSDGYNRWWGRTRTGLALVMDSVPERIFERQAGA